MTNIEILKKEILDLVKPNYLEAILKDLDLLSEKDLNLCLKSIKSDKSNKYILRLIWENNLFNVISVQTENEEGKLRCISLIVK